MCDSKPLPTSIGIVVLLAVWIAIAFHVAAEEAPKHQVPPAKHGGKVVVLCDGTTSVEVKGDADTPLPPAEAQAAADELMTKWREKNPDAKWDGSLVAQNAIPNSAGTPPSPRSPPQIPAAPNAPNAGASMQGQGRVNASAGATQVPGNKGNLQVGDTYGAFSSRDELIWKASVDQMVEDGNRIFHDAKRLGGTTGISCDMCHPNAANTHAETYPKYQVQLGRVAMLRDMINWCIENPVRGTPLADDSNEMKALEAFITSMAKGKVMDYGKH